MLTTILRALRDDFARLVLVAGMAWVMAIGLDTLLSFYSL